MKKPVYLVNKTTSSYKEKNWNFTVNRDHSKETRVVTYSTPTDILVDISAMYIAVLTELGRYRWPPLFLGLSLFYFFFLSIFIASNFFPTYIAQYFAHHLAIFLLIKGFSWCISSF